MWRAGGSTKKRLIDEHTAMNGTMIPHARRRMRNVGDICNFAIKRTRQCFFGNESATGVITRRWPHLGAAVCGRAAPFFEAVAYASKNIITLTRHSQSGCDVSHKITVYFSPRCEKKRRRNCGAHTPSKVKAKRREGTGGRVPPFWLRDVPGHGARPKTSRGEKATDHNAPQ